LGSYGSEALTELGIKPGEEPDAQFGLELVRQLAAVASCERKVHEPEGSGECECGPDGGGCGVDTDEGQSGERHNESKAHELHQEADDGADGVVGVCAVRHSSTIHRTLLKRNSPENLISGELRRSFSGV
jgi:hypothetical protein